MREHERQAETRGGSLLESKDVAIKAAEAALKKKALSPVILDLAGLTVIADFFVICSGESTTQVRAISEAVEQDLLLIGKRPIGIEGLSHGHWVLLDYGDVIVHVFEKETREFYSLEKLWLDAKTQDIDLEKNKAHLAGKDKRAVHR
ncbi:MAG: ribosome silencing factor [Thermodesulfovibrionales bacterium]